MKHPHTLDVIPRAEASASVVPPDFWAGRGKRPRSQRQRALDEDRTAKAHVEARILAAFATPDQEQSE